MAHEIDMSNRRANIAYVGEKPWHGLGQALTPDSPIEVWTVEAGMDWNIKSAPINFVVDGQSQTYDGKCVLYRDDTKTELSVVSEGYKIVQPKQILEFFRDLVAIGDMKLETAGCLFGGARYWALANTGREDDVIGNDRVRGMLLLTTSCDGTLATTAKFTSVRVVCNNTLRIALNHDEKAQSVRVTHGSVFNPEKIKAALGLLDTGWDTFMGQIRSMASKKMTDLDAKNFFAKIMLNEEQMKAFEAEEALHGRIQSKLDKLFDMYNGSGMGADMTKGTVWGALNAVTEYADHSIGVKPDNQLWNSWFGFGENLKNKAFDEALIMV